MHELLSDGIVTLLCETRLLPKVWQENTKKQNPVHACSRWTCLSHSQLSKSSCGRGSRSTLQTMLAALGGPDQSCKTYGPRPTKGSDLANTELIQVSCCAAPKHTKRFVSCMSGHLYADELFSSSDRSLSLLLEIFERVKSVTRSFHLRNSQTDNKNHKWSFPEPARGNTARPVCWFLLQTQPTQRLQTALSKYSGVL